MKSVLVPLALLLAHTSAALAVPPQGSCTPGWLPTFDGQSGLNGQVSTAVVFDDGSGPQLYLGGVFTAAGGIPADHIARWNGSSWSALPGSSGGSISAINALTVFDDGSGLALYAAGMFTNIGGTSAQNIAKWNGTSWSALGSGVGTASESVGALTAFDDGGGPRLYAGGYFTSAGGQPANFIARWDGANWSPLGNGLNNYVTSLAVYDDGSGPGLFAGGEFVTANGNPAFHIARWRNSSWTALGSGTNGRVKTLAVFDDGSGPKLYAGGSFNIAGGVPAQSVASWNGASWSALGSGPNSDPSSLTVYDDGSGPALYQGGLASSVSRWNGASWVALGSAASGMVRALAGYDGGSGPRLYALGNLSGIGGTVVANAARWDGTSWSPLASGSGLNGNVLALASRTEPGGPRLYATGDFISSGSASLNRIGCWDGASWSPLGGGLDDTGRCLAFYDDGAGEALYVGGDFNTVGGVNIFHVAKWDGTHWSPLGSGIPAFTSTVNALAVFDDGGGPALYAGGDFSTIGGFPANRIAKWDGSSWTAVGSGVYNIVATLITHDDGSGMALYAGGSLTSAGGVPVAGLARWNGTAWSAVGAGPSNVVVALARYDDGSGLALYAGGYFSAGGGGAGNFVAKWDGTAWSTLGGGTDHNVSALCVHDDGSGSALYAGGQFTHADGAPASRIARWDGASWSALGSGTFDRIYALAHLDSPGGAALIAGGSFASAPDSGDSYLARWGNPAGCGAPGVSLCQPGTGGVMPCPCGNPPAGLGRGCDNSSNTGGAVLEATGIARLGYDGVVFVTSGERPSATSVVLQGSALSGGGVVFGQGVRCIAGSLKRLYVRNAVNGSIQVPQGADPSVSARSAALGDPIAPGAHREYGVYYRDPNVLGGCPAASTFNITQQLDVAWAP